MLQTQPPPPRTRGRAGRTHGVREEATTRGILDELGPPGRSRRVQRGRARRDEQAPRPTSPRCAGPAAPSTRPRITTPTATRPGRSVTAPAAPAPSTSGAGAAPDLAARPATTAGF